MAVAGRSSPSTPNPADGGQGTGGGAEPPGCSHLGGGSDPAPAGIRRGGRTEETAPGGLEDPGGGDGGDSRAMWVEHVASRPPGSTLPPPIPPIILAM